MAKKIKVAPADTNKTKFEKRCMCFCEMFSPVFATIRIFALFPLKWKHEDRCIYRWSWSWGTYTILCIIAQGYLAISCAKYSTMFSSDKRILSLLDDITSIVYSHYVLATLVFNLLRIPGSMKTLEMFTQLPEKLICNSARKTSHRIQRFSVLVNYFVVFVHAVLLLWVYCTDEYHQDGLHSVLNRLTQSYPFATYLIQTTFIGCVDYGLVCQERLARNAYGYSKLHPNLNLNESNNNRKFLFIFPYKICTGDHDASRIFRKKSTAEVVEILRSRHEECCKILYVVNETGNPYFLVHMLVEFLVLVIHWYAVVLHMTHNLSGAGNDSIHTRNCIFVIFHTAGLVYFLNIAHKVKDLIQTMKVILLEYSTRVTDQQTLLQIRLFLLKLDQYRPFTANKVFEVDLKVAVSMFANILTYVLVALQFEVSDV